MKRTDYLRYLATVEVSFLICSTVLYFWFLRVHPDRTVFLLVFILWFPVSNYLFKENRRHIGFRLDGFKILFKFFVIPSAIFSVLAFVVAWYARTVRQIGLTYMIGILLAYVIWGLVQQYIMNGFFTNRLARIFGRNSYYVPIAVALIFSFLHLPNKFLMVVALIGGYFMSRVYLEFRNLYPLALCHAIIGWTIAMTFPDSLIHNMSVWISSPILSLK